MAMRVRGTAWLWLASGIRFIPARAGNSLPSWIATGSSPRVRGTDRLRRRRQPLGRFIPARAGNRCRDAADNLWVGSSPRVRGTDAVFATEDHWMRFIPARAGNRPKLSIFRRLPTVHPRACGEQPPMPIRDRSTAGSSPRVRGAPQPVHPRACGELHSRFIPARAGNRQVRNRPGIVPPVHPRACGEQTDHRCSACRNGGSSPRVRGTGKTAIKCRRAALQQLHNTIVAAPEEKCVTRSATSPACDACVPVRPGGRTRSGRRESRPSRPPTPPCVRFRTRRFKCSAAESGVD